MSEWDVDVEEGGDGCVGFFSRNGDGSCYMFPEGAASGWNDMDHTSASGGYTSYRKCSGSSPPPPPCAAGTSGSPGSCADCAAGQYQNSGGQGSCITW